MAPRLTHWPVRRLAARRRLIALLAALSGGLVPAHAEAHPHIRRWEYRATVTAMFDEYEEFTDIRRGDEVRGTLSFDRTALGDHYTRPSHPEETQSYYAHAPQFSIITMEIENLRIGEVVPYPNDENDGLNVFNDTCCFYGGPPAPDQIDLIIFGEYFLPPPQSALDWTYAEVWFEAEEAIPSSAPPNLINLQDWSASLYLSDGYFDSWAAAEIFELTPVDVPFIAGDFNGDGAVNARDLGVWRYVNGSINTNLAADANGDDRVDGADFLAWQRQLGVGPASGAALQGSASVPEPAAWALLASAIAALALVTRRRANTHSPA